MTNNQLRIEIVGRDEFWGNAVLVEWEHRHPQRKLVSEVSGWYLIETEWLEELKDVAADCYSTIVVGPTDPSRRSWFQQFLPSRNETEA